MKKRKFGSTDLLVSEVGFGAWGIGGPAMAGDIPIGWGNVNDETSIKALKKAYEIGINFYDTADFYGLGHSEELIGDVFGNSSDVVIATKVGHRLADDKSILLDYSKKHIMQACEQSLKRLKRDVIDYYQLHSAKLAHLQNGECVEAMEDLRNQGKIRYWGLSLNTFHPEPEADFMMANKIGNGFQLVLNVINQRALPTIEKSVERGYGIIARMPIQFGLLTGKFTKETRFEKNDHRYFRLPPEMLEKSIEYLNDVWPVAEKYGISKTSLSMSFILNVPGVSTVIPGIKTPEQAVLNSADLTELDSEDQNYLLNLYKDKLYKLVDLMEEQG